MHLELHRDSAIFENICTEWNALLDHGVSRVPFLRAEYQRAWWQYRGGGEWPEAELSVVVARDDSGKLMGIAPLFAARNRDGRPALLFNGSIEISDYLDVIVAPPDLEAFCAALLDRLTQPDVPAWEVLDLYNLPAGSPTRAALLRAVARRGWGVAEQELEVTPQIALPDTWEAYLALMDKKERHELKRKMRRAASGEAQVIWRVADNTVDLTGALETFLNLMALDADKARFLTPAMRAQFVEIGRAAQAGGWLMLAFLEVNGQPAAAYLNFDYAGRVWVYNSAIDSRFNALSAGWVLLGHLLQWATENKRAAFDFMRGGEDYKFRFGATAEKIYRLQINRGVFPAGAPAAPPPP